MSNQTSAQVVKKLHDLGVDFDQQLNAAATEYDIRQVKAAFLGKQGHLSAILKSLGSVSAEERPVIGREANLLKERLEAAFKSALDNLQKKSQAARLQQESLDPTLPGIHYSPGSLHPITQVMSEIEALFRSMGFEICVGPEVETEYFNFEALNIPAEHPARDMQDTFYLKDVGAPLGAPDEVARQASPLLRTHTSPVQIHVMKKRQPPIQMIAPGPVYRRDSDVTHTPLFHQIEGLLVDKDITFAQLKGVLEVFLQEFFGPETAVRFRPSYFPFTEPSAEVDISCVMCPEHRSNGAGIGCRVCQQTGWLEVMGCGMVHPAVFRAVDYDPEQWSGFAFGMGIERLAMLRYRINDIRLFYENDWRFLEQFK